MIQINNGLDNTDIFTELATIVYLRKMQVPRSEGHYYAIASFSNAIARAVPTRRNAART